MKRDWFADFERADSVLAGALELAGDERRSFIERECTGDEALRERVMALLAAAEDDAGAMAPGGALSGAVWADLDQGDKPRESFEGRTFGPWQAETEIGRGGMAVVYRARRADGAFEQDAAVKILHAPPFPGRMAARFAQERDILARLDHPNIARLLDGGTTDSGTSYLVMEYVEGEPIDAYCDGLNLTIEARLHLFLEVCKAVQCAHRQLIIHRDLKPANILVTADGRPKLLDFGIAKLLEPEPGAVDPAQTALMDRVVTPRYASPEQVLGEPVSTATDVHALGLLLYELLSGRPARRIETSRPSEVERLVCEETPPAPSSRVADEATTIELARARRLTPKALRRRLGGDLDNIVLKALRREPGRRYESAEQLAADVHRHLDSRPVRARPDSAGYRARKFVQRHRRGVAMAAVLAIVLAGAVIALAFQAQRIAAERDRARETSDFLVTLFEQFEPAKTHGDTVATRQVLDRAAARVKNGLDGQPLLQADLLATLGRVYQYRGYFDEAQALLEESLDKRILVLGTNHVAVADGRLALGILRYNMDRFDAIEQFESAAGTYRDRLGRDHPKVVHALTNQALALRSRGDYTAAESRFREVIALERQSTRLDPAATATARTYLGKLLTWRGDFDRAETMLESALALRRGSLGKTHPTVANAVEALGELHLAKGEYAAAGEQFHQAQAIRQSIFEPGHPDLAAGLANLGRLHRARRDYATAEEALSRALAIYRRAFGESPTVAEVLVNLGGIRTDRGELERAEATFDEASRVLQGQGIEPSLPGRVTMLREIAGLRMAQGDFQAAERRLREALSILQGKASTGSADQARSVPPWRMARLRADLGRTLLHADRPDEAEPLLTTGFQALEDGLGLDHPHTRETAATLATLYESTRQPALEAKYRRLLAER